MTVPTVIAMESNGSPQGHRPPKGRKVDFRHEITILVGRKEERLIAHKDILVKNSTFFQSALSGRWFESAEKTIKLPEQTPFSLSLYLNWLYGGFINLTEEDDVIETYESGGHIYEDG